LRAEADAEHRHARERRVAQQQHLAAEVPVTGDVVGMHRAAEHHQAGGVLDELGDGVAAPRVHELQRDAARGRELADEPGALVLRMLDDDDLRHRAPYTRGIDVLRACSISIRSILLSSASTRRSSSTTRATSPRSKMRGSSLDDAASDTVDTLRSITSATIVVAGSTLPLTRWWSTSLSVTMPASLP